MEIFPSNSGPIFATADHRPIIKRRTADFDIVRNPSPHLPHVVTSHYPISQFIYMEDDVIFTAEHLLAYVEETRLLQHPSPSGHSGGLGALGDKATAVGFMRVSRDPQNMDDRPVRTVHRWILSTE